MLPLDGLGDPYLFVDDAKKLVEFLKNAFGAKEHVEDIVRALN